MPSFVGSEMCIRDRFIIWQALQIIFLFVLTLTVFIQKNNSNIVLLFNELLFFDF